MLEDATLGYLTDRAKTGLANGRALIAFSMKERSSEASVRQVFFDLEDPRLERYLYWLVKMFDIAGWGVSMRARPWLLLNLRNCSEHIYDIEGLRFTLGVPSGADLVISQRPRKNQGIALDTDYFRSGNQSDSFRLPFSMHPDVYHTGLYRSLRRNDGSAERHVRVFLGGNLDPLSYSSPAMMEKFGLMNRAEVADAVVDAFRECGGFHEICSAADASPVLERGDPYRMILMRNAVLGLDEWMKMLAMSDFFIAPPGVIMPFSHNIIEAMAAGAIPITQYGHLFDPPLVDGDTCFEFSDRRSLSEAIERALNAGAEEVGRLRTNVRRYYDLHLEPSSIVNNIYEGRDRIKRIYIIAGHLSVR